MNAWVRGCSATLGTAVTRGSLAGIALGTATLLGGLVLGHAATAIGALAASWLFFAGIAAGAVAFSAAIRLSRGRWADDVLPIAAAGEAFLLPSLLLLALLVLTANLWIPGIAGSGRWRGLAMRDLAATAALAFAGRRYVGASPADTAQAHAVARRAILYLVLYTATLSLWAVDLVMGLAEGAPSTVIPPLYFMGAFLGGMAWCTLIHSARKSNLPSSNTRYDLGKLLFAFSIFWGYLLWAAYLPVWYGNLPEETGQLLARWRGNWRFLSVSVIVAVFGLPFVLLLSEGTKRHRATLGLGAASILAGLLGESYLLVVPSLSPQARPWDVIEATGAMLAMLGGLLLAVGMRLAPIQPDREGERT